MQARFVPRRLGSTARRGAGSGSGSGCLSPGVPAAYGRRIPKRWPSGTAPVPYRYVRVLSRNPSAVLHTVRPVPLLVQDDGLAAPGTAADGSGGGRVAVTGSENNPGTVLASGM